MSLLHVSAFTRPSSEKLCQRKSDTPNYVENVHAYDIPVLLCIQPQWCWIFETEKYRRNIIDVKWIFVVDRLLDLVLSLWYITFATLWWMKFVRHFLKIKYLGGGDRFPKYTEAKYENNTCSIRPDNLSCIKYLALRDSFVWANSYNFPDLNLPMDNDVVSKS